MQESRERKISPSLAIPSKIFLFFKAVINTPIHKDLKYAKASETFGQFQDARYSYGLNYASKKEADDIANAILKACEALSTSSTPPMAAQQAVNSASSASSESSPSSSSLAQQGNKVKWVVFIQHDGKKYKHARDSGISNLSTLEDEIRSKLKITGSLDIEYLDQAAKDFVVLDDSNVAEIRGVGETLRVERHTRPQPLSPADVISADTANFRRSSFVTAPPSADSIPFVQLTNVLKINEGNFGEVYKAQWQGTSVALKTIKNVAFNSEFEKEINTMRSLHHPHIVQFFGTSTSERGEIFLVMEYMSEGSLLSLLRTKGKSIDTNELMFMAAQAASGMQYLESKKIIHRDLALRNVLVSTTSLIVKIADFGMSRAGGIYLPKQEKELPLLWCAPEILTADQPIFTHKSDVWAFGILLWELFSYGDRPYPQHLTPQQAIRDITMSGYRLPSPQGCPVNAYEIMLHCWESQPDDRPFFAEVHDALVQSKSSGYKYEKRVNVRKALNQQHR